MIRFTQAARWLAAAVLVTGGLASAAHAGDAGAKRKPFRIYGNTYYVGSAGHAAVLIISDYGSVLIDTGPKDIASQVAANITELGFKLNEVKAVLLSDTKPEHAGGVAEIQQLTGAQVYTMRPGDQKIRGMLKPLKQDPREGVAVGSIPQLPQVWVVQDDQLLGVASVRVRALATPGGAPEGVTWSWDACDGSKCIPTVFAAALGGKGADAKAGEASLARIEAAGCQLVLTPNPEDSGGLDRLEKAEGKQDAVKTDGACKAYAAARRGK